MKSGCPQKIAINHDDYYAEHIGKTNTGLQFFLTTPFEAAVGEKEGCEYIALFKFSENGSFLESTIDNLGPRGSYDQDERKEKYLLRLKELGDVEFCRIEIKPFSIKFNGVDFGLITREPEEEDDVWAVEFLPGNYMAFFEPWDSGEYDT